MIDDAIDGRPEPGEGEAVVKILQADGGYIYRVQVTLRLKTIIFLIN